MEKLRILQLVPRFPFPADDGGKIGIANIYKEFSKQGSKVTLFALGDEIIPESSLSEAEKFGEVIIFNHNTSNTKSRILKSLLFNHSIYLHKYLSEDIKNEIDKIITSQTFDIIHADHSCMAPLAFYVKSKLNIPIGLRLHNIEWLIWQRYVDILPPFSPQKIYISHQAKLLKKAESKIYGKMDVCFTITEPDKQRALELAPKAKISIAGAGVNTDEWKPDESIKRNNYELILATTFNWIHNVNAIKWFIKEVLPIVKKNIPDIKLTLIGKNAPKWLKEFEYQGVNLIGYVDKVQPYYNKASINIAPLFVGGGIRIKILEAMAMELPVVASSIAAEGIYANENNGIFIADSKEEFAHQIIRLCIDTGLARLSGKLARNYVIKEYSWERNVGIMLKAYCKLV